MRICTLIPISYGYSVPLRDLDKCDSSVTMGLSTGPFPHLTNLSRHRHPLLPSVRGLSWVSEGLSVYGDSCTLGCLWVPLFKG